MTNIKKKAMNKLQELAEHINSHIQHQRSFPFAMVDRYIDAWNLIDLTGEGGICTDGKWKIVECEHGVEVVRMEEEFFK
jgi:hypothetical protein